MDNLNFKFMYNNKNSFNQLSKKDLLKVNGGGMLELALAYLAFAAGACYELGKSGKSARSYGGDSQTVEIDAISYAG